MICIFTTAMVKAQVTYPEAPQEPEPQPVTEVQIDTVQQPRRQPAIQDYFKPYVISPAGVGNNVLQEPIKGKAALAWV